MARSLKFTVSREPLDLELGGDRFTAPAILAPTALAELLDMQAGMSSVFSKLTAAGETGVVGDVERGAMYEALEFIAQIFDKIFGEGTDSAARFQERLFSKDRSFDLTREVVPAITALVEEYSGGRPTQPSSPSLMLPGGDGITSTATQPPAGSIHLGSHLTASAT